jgi:NADH:ubiquinone oxidoreductase subunit 4 (subunit M)
LNRRELALLVAVALLIVLIGVFPNYVLNPMQASITQLLGTGGVTLLVK